ncbi:MAG: thiamine phosphate synthase, partial [Rhodospirillaceae bacterium]|nr:thiamine phosphate synthase [Rhodospirillaceae bacterium]
MADPDCRLYLITPPDIVPVSFADTLAKTLDAGDVACLQLRMKDASDDEIRRAVDILKPITQSRDVAFLLNDNAQLAADTGCDGVHIG